MFSNKICDSTVLVTLHSPSGNSVCVGVLLHYVTWPAVADIPGLIPGAHLDKGLGHAFLRHVERCKSLLYILDASSSDPDMCSQLQTLQTELTCYKADLCQHASLIVANKMDVMREHEGVLDPLLQSAHLPVLPVSALYQWNTDILIDILASYKTVT